MDQHKYISQVRSLLAQMDADAPGEYGIEQKSMLTGNAYYCGRSGICWLEVSIKHDLKTGEAIGSNPMIVWASYTDPDLLPPWYDPYPGLVVTPEANIDELNRGDYDPILEKDGVKL